MISFFRKIRTALLAEGKTGKYLKYAIGEILLVMIGILLALQVNNWNEYRKARTEEDKILREIRRNLVIDISALDRVMNRSLYQGKKYEKLLYLIKQDSFLKGNALDTLFGSVLEYYQFDLNITPFQEVDSKGINIVSNDSLRLKIINVYEVSNRRLEHINNSEKTISTEVIRPYYFHNFNNIDFLSQLAKPRHIEELIKDDYFVNILEYRLTIKNRNQIWWSGIREEMIKLKEMIDEHFGES